MEKRFSFKRFGDIGSRYRRDVIFDIVNDTLVARSRKKLSFEILYKRRTINEEQYLAAEKLWETYQKSHPIHNCEYREPTDGGGFISESDRMLINRDLYEKALKALDMNERPLIIYVIINDNPLNKPNSSGYEKRRRRDRLRYSLDKIARHYNFI